MSSGTCAPAPVSPCFCHFSPFKAQFKCCHFHKASPTPQVARIRFFFGLDFPSGLIHCVLILCYLYYWFSGKKFPTTSPSHRWDMVGSPSWSFRAKACLGGHWTKVSTWGGLAYQSPRVAVTTYYKLGSLKQQKCTLPQSWTPEVQNESVSGVSFLRRLREPSRCFSPSFTTTPGVAASPAASPASLQSLPLPSRGIVLWVSLCPLFLLEGHPSLV